MLAEASYEETALAMNSKGDEKLIVRFFKHPLKNDLKTEQEGRPIYDEVDHISIRIPGDKTSEILRPIRPEDKQRFPRHWLQYQAGQEQGVSGTPLAEWPVMNRAQVEEMAFFNVKTVEQLADLNDIHCQKWPGINKLKLQARAFLDYAKEGSAPIAKLTAQIEERDNMIETMRKQLADLQSSVDTLKKDKREK